MMPFHFSIRTALRQSWHVVITHAWFFITLSVINLILNVVDRSSSNPIITVLVVIAAIVWSYVGFSVSLAAVDGKHDQLNIKSLQQHLPTFRNVLKLVAVGIVVGLITLLGFVALIIPGIYFMIRLSFSNLAYVDHKGGIMEAVRFSWHIVTTKVFWTVFATIAVMIGLMIAGAIVFFVGLFIAYPVAMILQAKLYRALSEYHSATQG